MKKFNRFCLVATLTAPLLLAACMDNDVYDPEKRVRFLRQKTPSEVISTPPTASTGPW